jgi:hypothetical protein
MSDFHGFLRIQQLPLDHWREEIDRLRSFVPLMIGLFRLHRRQLELATKQGRGVSRGGLEVCPFDPAILMKLIASQDQTGVIVVGPVSNQNAEHSFIGMLEVAKLFADHVGSWIACICREGVEPKAAYGAHTRARLLGAAGAG